MSLKVTKVGKPNPWWRRKRFSLFMDIGIPGPKPSLFSGNLSELIERGASQTFDTWVNKYGDVVGFYNGAKPMLLVKDLDLIKKIQIKDFGNFHGRGVTSAVNRQHQVSKFNLINVDGERWKDMRSLLTPAFTSSNMKKMLPLLDTCTDEFLEVLDSLHEQEKAFEIREVFQKLSLDVIVRSAFGVQSNVQKNPGTTGMNAIVKIILDGLNEFRTGWMEFFVACFPEFSFVWKLVLMWRQRFMKLPVDKMYNCIMPIIDIRRSNPEASFRSWLFVTLTF
ncbi:cytochrome P450 3A4 [Ixodes scapularis]